VVVDGRVVVRDRDLVGTDVEGLLAEVREAAARARRLLAT
jgi:hypothetical protein